MFENDPTKRVFMRGGCRGGGCGCGFVGLGVGVGVGGGGPAGRYIYATALRLIV